MFDIADTTGLVVKTDPAGDGSFSQTWTSGTDFQLEPLNGGVAAGGDTAAPYAFWEIVAIGALLFPVFGSGRAGLQVTTKFGWSAIADEVNQASTLKAANVIHRRDAPFGVLAQPDIGVVRISRRGDPDVVDFLEPFVMRRVRSN